MLLSIDPSLKERLRHRIRCKTSAAGAADSEHVLKVAVSRSATAEHEDNRKQSRFAPMHRTVPELRSSCCRIEKSHQHDTKAAVAQSEHSGPRLLFTSPSHRIEMLLGTIYRTPVIGAVLGPQPAQRGGIFGRRKRREWCNNRKRSGCGQFPQPCHPSRVESPPDTPGSAPPR
jgi:hypothetical protein